MQFRTILLEDDDNARELLATLLRKRGHEVYSFSAPSACPLYADPECLCPQDHACGDFLITDNRMPGITGLEFIQRQTAGKCRGAIRNKAIMSGNWTAQEWELATGLGCRLFNKPLDLQELWDWIGERERCIPRDRKLLAIK